MVVFFISNPLARIMISRMSLDDLVPCCILFTSSGNFDIPQLTYHLPNAGALSEKLLKVLSKNRFFSDNPVTPLVKFSSSCLYFVKSEDNFNSFLATFFPF